MQPSPSEISIIFIGGTAIMLLVFAFIFLFVVLYERKRSKYRVSLQQIEIDSQKKMLEAMITTEEREKQYFAGELHDSLGQLLSAILMKLNSMDAKLKQVDGAAAINGLLSDTKEIARNSIEEVRSISRKLLPNVLKDFGLKQAIGEMCSKLSDSSGMQVHFDFSCDSERFPVETERAIFRITQELINNTIKHAHASEINILLHEKASMLHYEYSDNGVGMHIENKKGTGLGLMSIESRVSFLSGSVQVTSQKNNGVNFTITIPLV